MVSAKISCHIGAWSFVLVLFAVFMVVPFLHLAPIPTNVDVNAEVCNSSIAVGAGDVLCDLTVPHTVAVGRGDVIAAHVVGDLVIIVVFVLLLLETLTILSSSSLSLSSCSSCSSVEELSSLVKFNGSSDVVTGLVEDLSCMIGSK